MVTGLAAFLTVFAVASAGCCWLAYRYACWRQLVDLPGERRSHQVATPRGGGAGIVLAMLLAQVAGVWVLPAWRDCIALTGLALLSVAGIGWWDDHRPLPAMRRLCVHLFAAVLVGLSLMRLGYGWMGMGLALLVVPVMINFWNFMDGINGLVVSQVALASLSLCMFLSPVPAVFGLCLGIACLVFLPMNFPAARIFLGDVGSGALGLLLATLTLSAVFEGWGSGDMFLPLLVLLPLGMDAGLTLLWRVARGENPTQAHRDHLYQWAVRSGCTHAAVTGFYFLATLSLVVLSIQFRGVDMAGSVLLLTLSTGASAIIWRIVRGWIQRQARMN